MFYPHKILLIVMIMALTGCMSSKPYRYILSTDRCVYTNKNDCESEAQTISNVAKDTTYQLSFFEFDDQGRLHLPDQKKQIMDRYRNIASKEDVLLLTFVHGWHHNADGSPEDSNIVDFREMLAQAAKALPTKQVLGAYIGWRGDSFRTEIPVIEIDFFNWITFWERKSTAHEIGTQGLTALLLELEDVVEPIGGKEHRMVTIGHSFGGAALYSAVGPILEERLVSNRPFTSENGVEGFGDLVVLLNPAFEALKYYSLFHLSQDQCRAYPDTQRPKLVTVSSPNDFPVSWLFPTGRRLNVLFEAHRDADNVQCTRNGSEDFLLIQSKADRFAIGHYTPFITHDLEMSPGVKSAFSQKTDVKSYSQIWTKQVAEGVFTFNDMILTSKDRTKPGNPYFNIWTEDEEITDGHNDIWTMPLKTFLYDLVFLSSE